LGPLRRIFLFVLLHLPELKNINTRSHTQLLAQMRGRRSDPLGLRSFISHAFLHRVSSASDLVDVTDILEDSCDLTLSTLS